MVRATGTEQWFFALGTLVEVVGIGWPAVEVKDKDGDVVGYLPQKEPPENARDLIEYFPVTKVWPLEESEYEAVAFKAQGPLASACFGQTLTACIGSKPDTTAHPTSSFKAGADRKYTIRGIVAVPTSKPEPVLKAAARLCFMEWGSTLLKQLPQHLGVGLAPKVKLFDVLTKLLQHILAPLEEEDLIDILARREFKKDPLEAVLNSEDMVA